jgi:hypothetical protein
LRGSGSSTRKDRRQTCIEDNAGSFPGVNFIDDSAGRIQPAQFVKGIKLLGARHQRARGACPAQPIVYPARPPLLKWRFASAMNTPGKRRFSKTVPGTWSRKPAAGDGILCTHGDALTGYFLNRFFLSNDVSLKIDSRKQDHHTIRTLDFPVEDPYKVTERAVAYPYFIAGFEGVADADESVFTYPGFDGVDNLLINRSGAFAEADNAVNSSCQANLAEQLIRGKMSEDIP